MQRNFEPMRLQTEQWLAQQLSGATAKLIIYQALIEGGLQARKHLAGVVHDLSGSSFPPGLTPPSTAPQR